MCTTIAIGKKATANGSVVIAHSDDDVADERLIRVPATTNNPAGSKRPVYYDDAALGPQPVVAGSKVNYNASGFYRYIGSARGPAYQIDAARMKKDCLYDSIAIGSIPQVPSTYAYFDCNYGVMNEAGLMIGECTCGAKVHPLPSKDRLFYAAELSRVALERCSKARDAVLLMGQLIRDFGLYGTGETLLVGDADEAWVMEMCGYDMNGKNGIWVAQRVPDDGFFVAANQFRIREVRADAPGEMLFSDNLHRVCEGLGWWSPKKSPLLDWAATVSFGEYSHPYYSLRRVWRALVKAKPSSNLPAWVENGYTTAYPFTLTPDVKLDIAGVADIYRDNYEGTEFDMNKGFAAGPWGDPTRYENNPDKGNAFELSVNTPDGAWERPISIYRCGILWINEANAAWRGIAANGISWVGLDRPATNCLMPFFCKVTALPKLVETMNLADYSRDSLWWAFNFVANYLPLKYSYMKADLDKVRTPLEQAGYDGAEKLLGKKSVEALTKFCTANAEAVGKAWWDLAAKLIVTYNNGCYTAKGTKFDDDGIRVNNDIVMQKIDYPARWLSQSNYGRGPTCYSKQDCLERGAANR